MDALAGACGQAGGKARRAGSAGEVVNVVLIVRGARVLITEYAPMGREEAANGPAYYKADVAIETSYSAKTNRLSWCVRKNRCGRTFEWQDGPIDTDAIILAPVAVES